MCLPLGALFLSVDLISNVDIQLLFLTTNQMLL
jgi:hypothetical protein